MRITFKLRTKTQILALCYSSESDHGIICLYLPYEARSFTLTGNGEQRLCGFSVQPLTELSPHQIIVI